MLSGINMCGFGRWGGIRDLSVIMLYIKQSSDNIVKFQTKYDKRSFSSANVVCEWFRNSSVDNMTRKCGHVTSLPTSSVCACCWVKLCYWLWYLQWRPHVFVASLAVCNNLFGIQKFFILAVRCSEDFWVPNWLCQLDGTVLISCVIGGSFSLIEIAISHYIKDLP